MEISYRNALINDIDFLVQSRLDFINISNTDLNYGLIRENLYQYFKNALKEDKCDIVLAEENNLIIGTGIVFYYDSVPSLFNPWGKNAYITSMFVHADYRRQGIATTILDKLVHIVKTKNYHVIFLTATDVGRALYEKYGFCDGKTGMLLKL